MVKFLSFSNHKSIFNENLELFYNKQKLMSFCLIYSYKDPQLKYRLFIGNSGTGKSTLANCVAQKKLFESGISFGSSKTSRSELKDSKGVYYLDTPGFDDTKFRQTAAKAVTSALKKNGIYQIFFVLTLSSGRLRPQDVETIRLVLEHAKDIRSYIILVNKLSKRDSENFQTIKKEILNEVKKLEVQYGRSNPHIVPVLNDKKLNDAENKFLTFEHLNRQIRDAEWVELNPNNVKDIQDDYDLFKQSDYNLRNSTANSDSRTMNVRY